MQRMTPAVLLSVSLLAFGLVAAPAVAGPPPFTTTELIGGGTPITNGNDLLLAIGAAVPGTLIKLEPGTYDLQGQQILLPDFVDIEGSGRDITTIFSDLTGAITTPTVVDVSAGINGEIRQLTIRAAAETAVGVTSRSDELLLTEVNIELETNRSAVGVRIDGAASRLDEIFVRIFGANGNAIGFEITGGGEPALTSCLYFASNVVRRSIGVLIDEASPVIESTILFSLFNGTNVGVLVSGPTTQATIRNVRAVVQGDESIGVNVIKQSNARIKESSFFVRSDTLAAGIQLEEATAKVTETTFNVASLFGFSPNVWGARLDGPANLDSNQSNYESSVFAVENAGTGAARFGASQLIGAAVPAVFGPLVCAQSYNGAYAPVNNFCN
ncbi:MAG: hypothetical protein AAGF23_06450 [Acidobacteriota bacterium]